MSVFGAAETAEGIKDFVKSGKFAKTLKGISEDNVKMRSAIKASINDLNGIIKKVYSRQNGLVDVEFAGYGRITIKEAEILEDADEICKDRYAKWIEGKLAETSYVKSIDFSDKITKVGQQFSFYIIEQLILLVFSIILKVYQIRKIFTINEASFLLNC